MSTSFPRYFNEHVTRVRIVQKSRSWFMRFLSGCLWLSDKTNITAIGDFMGSYVTTIGHTIYGGPGWSMDMDVSSTLIHELTHVCENELDPLYNTRYLFSDKKRAYYEMTCVQAEMLFNPTHQTPEFVTKRARFFTSYGIPFDVAFNEGLKRLNEIRAGTPQPAVSMVMNAYHTWK